jgi:Uma2 family endonuclease
VLLAVEVMDTTVRRDRRLKLPLYTRAGIVEVWLVDLPADCIARYRRPAGETYLDHDVHRRGDRLAVAAIPDVEFAVAEILGT